MANTKDVARMARVSASTVSQLLNGKGDVNDAMRHCVMETVRHTRYQPNVLAKA